MATPPSAPDDPRLQGGELLAAISNQLVRLLRDATGRGPTQCKTFWAGDEMILVQIKGGYSAAEHTLAEAGHEDEVHSSRRALQDSIEDEMRNIVETRGGPSGGRLHEQHPPGPGHDDRGLRARPRVLTPRRCFARAVADSRTVWLRTTDPVSKTTSSTRRSRREGASKEKAARIANTDRQTAGNGGGQSESYEDWNKDDLESRAAELDIEGRSDMSKDELIDSLRNH